MAGAWREGGREKGRGLSRGGMEESEWGIKRLPAAVDTAPSLDRLGELRPSTQIELGQGLTGRIDTLSGGILHITSLTIEKL